MEHQLGPILLQCSKYHFEEKVLEKLIRVEFKIESHENTIAKWIENLSVGLDEIENLKQITKSFINVQKTEFDNIEEKIKQSLNKMETAVANCNNETVNRMNSYDELIETKLEEVTDSETDRNSAFALLRSEIRSSFNTTINSLEQNISTVWTKQTLLQEYFDDVKKRNKRNIAFSAFLVSRYSKHDIVKFDNVWTNVGNAYNPTTGVFSAPVPGLYSFTAVLLSDGGQSLFRHMWRNKERLAGSLVTEKGYKTGTMTVILELIKGDEVYIKSRSAGHGDVFSDSDKYSTFSGFYIG